MYLSQQSSEHLLQDTAGKHAPCTVCHSVSVTIPVSDLRICLADTAFSGVSGFCWKAFVCVHHGLTKLELCVKIIPPRAVCC